MAPSLAPIAFPEDFAESSMAGLAALRYLSLPLAIPAIVAVTCDRAPGARSLRSGSWRVVAIEAKLAS